MTRRPMRGRAGAKRARTGSESCSPSARSSFHASSSSARGPAAAAGAARGGSAAAGGCAPPASPPSARAAAGCAPSASAPSGRPCCGAGAGSAGPTARSSSCSRRPPRAISSATRALHARLMDRAASSGQVAARGGWAAVSMACRLGMASATAGGGAWHAARRFSLRQLQPPHS